MVKLDGQFLSFSQENSHTQVLDRWGPPRACEMYNYVFADTPPFHLNSLTGEPLTPKTEPPNQSWTEPIVPTGKSCVLAVAYIYFHKTKKQVVRHPLAGEPAC